MSSTPAKRGGSVHWRRRRKWHLPKKRSHQPLRSGAVLCTASFASFGKYRSNVINPCEAGRFCAPLSVLEERLEEFLGHQPLRSGAVLCTYSARYSSNSLSGRHQPLRSGAVLCTPTYCPFCKYCAHPCVINPCEAGRFCAPQKHAGGSTVAFPLSSTPAKRGGSVHRTKRQPVARLSTSVINPCEAGRFCAPIS